VAWLKQFASYPLTDVQRMGLAYLRVNPRMTNSNYRRLNNTTTVEATRDLRDLVDQGLIKMHGTRRWAYYTLVAGIEVEPEPKARPSGLVLDHVDRYGSITNQECRELFGWEKEERGKAYRLLRNLVQEGKLRKKGRGRGTRYARQ
jgi:predicted HTH transcriptional regulator